ncbi:hypothetical protein [Streptomyces xanthochromogenes]|uniref:hypothetical protein n=1 Tax=Streptomyces xanthochromogenes TaxID=67384 RepID=UPI002F428F65
MKAPRDRRGTDGRGTDRSGIDRCGADRRRTDRGGADRRSRTRSHVRRRAAAWVRPGTHVSGMGADASGKRELPPELFARARAFWDLPEQTRRMGESRHVPAGTVLAPLGEVLTHRAPGRADDSDITVFDSSGIGFQDLYPGLALLKKMDISL